VGALIAGKTGRNFGGFTEKMVGISEKMVTGFSRASFAPGTALPQVDAQPLLERRPRRDGAGEEDALLCLCLFDKADAAVGVVHGFDQVVVDLGWVS
jgi:hypothetical protein